jgi:hypothetical protein
MTQAQPDFRLNDIKDADMVGGLKRQAEVFAPTGDSHVIAFSLRCCLTPPNFLTDELSNSQYQHDLRYRNKGKIPRSTLE